MNDKPERLGPELVEAFVGSAHGDLEAVRELLAAEPVLANAAWDWGGGDWETALGAAAHMGRRDIAELLLDRGARLDIFAAAMLGEVEIVRALLAAFPGMQDARGPHGIPLVEHARKGGEQARQVLEFVKGGADRVEAGGHA
ncbi:MAG: ankyrin repeat domain-containing protein [Actinobacteria bacterium]|nr:ankyrin repeat domain-containing protein [Actinomycetota bacterium]